MYQLEQEFKTYLNFYGATNYKVETEATVWNQNPCSKQRGQLSSQCATQSEVKSQTHTDVLQQHGEPNSDIGDISFTPEHNNNISRLEFFKDWYAYFGERKTLLADIVDPDGKVNITDFHFFI